MTENSNTPETNYLFKIGQVQTVEHANIYLIQEEQQRSAVIIIKYIFVLGPQSIWCFTKS